MIFSSPYLRAIDTIKNFAEKNNFEIVCLDDFKERKIDNIWVEDYSSFAMKQWQDFNYKLSDGECLQEVQDRNIKALKDILAKNKNNKIAIGSHGTALSTIINYYDSSFGYEEFESIKKLMPWIVKFTFNDQLCINIEKINIFQY